MTQSTMARKRSVVPPFLFLVLLISFAEHGFGAGRRFIFFDMDGVLLFHVPADSQGQNVIRIPSVDGTQGSALEAYRVGDGVPEMIETVASRGWGVGIFSFGTPSRNEAAARAITLPNGKSLAEIVTDTGGVILSNRDGFNLDPTDPRTVMDLSIPKGLRPKIVKSLEVALPRHGIDPENAFLVDDQFNEVPDRVEGERLIVGRNHTHLIYSPYQWALDGEGREVEFQEFPDGFEQAVRNEDLVRARDAAKRFARLRNKSAWITGVILEMDRRKQRGVGTYSEILQDIMWARTGTGGFKIKMDGRRLQKPGVLDNRELILDGVTALQSVQGSKYAYTSPLNMAHLCGQLARALDLLLTKGR